jgi:hypothetical protein
MACRSLRRESWIHIRQQVGIRVHAEPQTGHSDDVFPQSLWPFSGEENGEEGDDENDVGNYAEDDQDNVDGDDEEPFDEDESTAELLGANQGEYRWVVTRIGRTARYSEGG